MKNREIYSNFEWFNFSPDLGERYSHVLVYVEMGDSVTRDDSILKPINSSRSNRFQIDAKLFHNGFERLLNI